MKVNFNNLRKLTLCTLALACVSCSSKFKHELNFNAGEPIRVAVMPFYQVDGKGQIVNPDNDFLIDNVALVSSKLKDTPGTFVRNLVQNELTKSGLDLVSPAVVDANLSHNGYDDLQANPPFNLTKISAAQPQDICRKVLDCDAVLFGKVTKWDRSYYAIQSVASVAIDLRLVSAKDGKVLFSSDAFDADSRGLTKGPTGLSNLVIEPLAGLDNDILTDLARKTVVKMLSPLKMENRPEFLQSSPPAIFASAHDAESGGVTGKEPLTIVASATPKQTVTFSIGNVIENVPMIERDSGHYIGKFLPLPGESFKNEPVYVSVTDQFGRETKQKIGNGNISIL